jgi:hypothetical protein
VRSARFLDRLAWQLEHNAKMRTALLGRPRQGFYALSDRARGRGGLLVVDRAVSRAVDQSSDRAASAMIDVEAEPDLRGRFGAAWMPYDICGENHGTNAS